MSDRIDDRDVPAAHPPTEAGRAAGHARAFDFLHGSWSVTHRKLRERLAGCTEWTKFPGELAVDEILGGLGNFDRNELADPAGDYQAHSLRLYNPARDTWSIWWLSSRAPALDEQVVGGFAGAKGTFFGDDQHAGEPVRVRTTYEPLSPDRAEWTQAFSPDGGVTWEVNWVMSFTRVQR